MSNDFLAALNALGPDSTTDERLAVVAEGLGAVTVGLDRESKLRRVVVLLGGVVAALVIALSLVVATNAADSKRQSDRIDAAFAQLIEFNNVRRVDNCNSANDVLGAMRVVVQLIPDSLDAYTLALVDPQVRSAANPDAVPRTPEQQAAIDKQLEVFRGIVTKLTGPKRDEVLVALADHDCDPAVLGAGAPTTEGG